jgi:DNA polymerase sigma
MISGGMERVVCIAYAKVPIVKMWDPELKLAADMNVNNTLALENTRMIKTYVQIDPRVRPLAMIVKHWTKQRMLNDAGETRNLVRGLKRHANEPQVPVAL